MKKLHNIRVWIAIFLLVTIVFFLPFPQTVARESSITVLITSGVPLIGVRVGRNWSRFLFDEETPYEQKPTDQNGQVHFDRKKRWLSLANWAFSSVFGIGIVHGDVRVEENYAISLREGLSAEVKGTVLLWSYVPGQFVTFSLTGLSMKRVHEIKVVLKETAMPTR
jgi:hypothetical protein